MSIFKLLMCSSTVLYISNVANQDISALIVGIPKLGEKENSMENHKMGTHTILIILRVKAGMEMEKEKEQDDDFVKVNSKGGTFPWLFGFKPIKKD